MYGIARHSGGRSWEDPIDFPRAYVRAVPSPAFSLGEEGVVPPALGRFEGEALFSRHFFASKRLPKKVRFVGRHRRRSPCFPLLLFAIRGSRRRRCLRTAIAREQPFLGWMKRRCPNASVYRRPHFLDARVSLHQFECDSLPGGLEDDEGKAPHAASDSRRRGIGTSPGGRKRKTLDREILISGTKERRGPREGRRRSWPGFSKIGGIFFPFESPERDPVGIPR